MIFCKQQHHMFLLGVCVNYMALAVPHSGNTFSLVRSVGQTLMSTFSSFSLCRTLTSDGKHLPQPRWSKIQSPDSPKLHNKGLLLYVKLLSSSFYSNMKGWYTNGYMGEVPWAKLGISGDCITVQFLWSFPSSGYQAQFPITSGCALSELKALWLSKAFILFWSPLIQKQHSHCNSTAGNTASEAEERQAQKTYFHAMGAEGNHG